MQIYKPLIHFKKVMSEVVSFKVKKEIKEKMVKYKDRVNWADELRKFVEEKIKQLEAEENFIKILKELEKSDWSVPNNFSVSLVRECRDSR